ncbi:hypothetical protein Hanom_Chr01g00054791 [Helianthus anomalus]
MLSSDENDFQPFALLDFGDDVPLADGFPVEDLFDIPAPVHDHLIIGHPDGEHIVEPILDAVPLVGDREIDDDVVVVPPPTIPVIELSSDSSLHSVSDSFESVTSSALRAAGLQLYATDSDDDTAMFAALSPARPDIAPIDPEPILDPGHVPFGLPDIAPLIPEPVPALFDLPLVDPFIPPPPPADVAPPPPVESNVHRTDLPIVFLQDIPAPRPGEGTSGQPPSYDPFASVAFPSIPQTTSFTPFTSTPLDEPFRWFPPFTMPIFDPYYPSHFVGYTRDELLLSLQLQFEILSRRVLELKLTPSCPPPCPCHSTFVPPHSTPPASFVLPPAAPAPFSGFDARFLPVEQQISYFIHRFYELEEELAHVRILLFFPPPPPPSAQ